MGGIAHLKICKTHRHLPCMTFSHFPVNIQRRNTLLKRPNSIKFDDFSYFPQGNMREIFQHLMLFLVFPMVFPHFPMVFPLKTPPTTSPPPARQTRHLFASGEAHQERPHPTAGTQLGGDGGFSRGHGHFPITIWLVVWNMNI